MKTKSTLGFTFTIALAAVMSASPALGQNGKGKGQEKSGERQRVEARDERNRAEEQRREARERRDREERRYSEGRLERRDGRKVPPGWCKGKGNPHNTVANCGTRGERYDPRYDDRRYDDRYDDRRSGSYAEAHAEFHRVHDRQCRERAAQRLLDLRWQVQVRSECKQVHDRWHQYRGVSHR